MSRSYAIRTTAGDRPAVKNQGSPYVQRLVFKVIPDATSQFNALQAGDVDIIFVNQPGQLQKLKQDKNIQSFEASLSSLVYLGYNTRQAPFDDARVRQALSHAVNKDEIVQTALGGIGKVAFAPIASTLPAFDPALKQYEQGFDLARARALLSEAGFEQGAGGAWERDGQPLTLKLLDLHPRPQRSDRNGAAGAVQSARRYGRDPGAGFCCRAGSGRQGTVRRHAVAL